MSLDIFNVGNLKGVRFSTNKILPTSIIQAVGTELLFGYLLHNVFNLECKTHYEYPITQPNSFISLSKYNY